MLHVDADFHSPSFRAMRYSGHSSLKRPRSPEVGSNSQVDRPLKRPSLMVTSQNVNIPSARMPRGHHIPREKSGNNSTYSPEDWVQQTDHLSIDSSALPGTNPFLRIERRLSLQDDGDVNMDSEEGLMPHHVQRLEVVSTRPLSSQTPFVQMSLHPSERPPPQSPSTLPEQSSLTTMLPESPTTNVFPPTPIRPTGPYSDPELQYPSTRPSSPESNSSMMVLSLLPSYVNFASSSPRRQQRFTMGPRADCEKCRLGVKGHWVHY